MAKVKIKCLNVSKFGQTVLFPIVGDVKIPSNGDAFEIDEEVAELLEGNKNYRIEAEETDFEDSTTNEGAKSSKKSGKSSKKIDAPKPTESDDDEDADDEDEEEEDALAQLNELELPELVAMAAQLKYPEAEYEKFKKKKALMVSYLKKKA